MSKSNLDFNILTTTTGQTPPCLQQKIDKTTYLVEVHFSDTSPQSVEDKLKRVTPIPFLFHAFTVVRNLFKMIISWQLYIIALTDEAKDRTKRQY